MQKIAISLRGAWRGVGPICACGPKGPLSPPKPIPVYNHTTYFQIPCFYYLYLWNVGKPSAQVVAVASEATPCLGQSQATLLRPASDY